MLKCIAKRCPKNSECCCYNCSYREFCAEPCKKDPKRCQDIRDTKEPRKEKVSRLKFKSYLLTEYERDNLRGIFEIKVLLVIAIMLIISVGVAVGIKLDYIEKTQYDIADQANYIRQEVESIDKAAENRSQVNSESLGTFTVTHYCSCEKCCGKTDGITATGTVAIEGRTVAVDPDVIPLGSEVLIDGQVYIAEDVGGAIHGNEVDIYVSSHQEALSRGKITREVFVN